MYGHHEMVDLKLRKKQRLALVSLARLTRDAKREPRTGRGIKFQVGRTQRPDTIPRREMRN